MTLPASGSISISDCSVEIGQAPTFSDNLGFLNSGILETQRPGNPNMSAFYSLAYFQNNAQGNCNNGNCTNQCNCGNIQCNNCIITGTVDCANCQSQQWFQNNCNCACTYNCQQGATTYNCNCACNCSKIICAKLYEFGYMESDIWAADQKYGQWLRKTDKAVYRGYVRWARIVTAWMDGKGQDYMVWIGDKEKRAARQKEAILAMALRIGSPWSEHMAWLMGAKKTDNLKGRILMEIGKPICRLVNLIPPNRKKNRKHKLATLYLMWALFWMSHWAASAVVALHKTKSKLKGIEYAD